MSDEKGWIKLHRRILESPVFHDEKLLKIWVACLLKANHKKKSIVFNNEVIEIQRGQFIFGRIEFAKELNMNSSSVYRRLKLLEKLKKVNIKSNNKFSVLSIVKYNTYQDDTRQSEQQNEQPVNNKRTASEQPVNTNNNVKNDNNERSVGENTNTGFIPEDSQVPFEEFGKAQLFSKSKYENNQELFTNDFKARNVAAFDPAYYYNAVRNWSASKNKRSCDWVAEASRWAENDLRQDKAVMKKAKSITQSNL